ncbi:MAG: hypothetical protein LBU83_02475 [Bacteroidales bacterium]|jgi:hypothetical protein|nr:hypothetical protein [Bacteroidales bacterium]
MNKIFTFFNRYSWILLSLFCLTTCKHKPKPVFDLNSPGGIIIASYNDTTPHVVFYYKVDEKGNPTQEKIGEAFYYDNKQEYVGGGLKDGKKEGKWYAFFKDGSVQTEVFYVDGQRHGDYNLYRENGKPLLKGHYDHGICNGTWYYYDETGKVKKKVKADKKTIVCEDCPKCNGLK